MDYKSLGARVRQERIRRSLTQEQLAEICDISSSFVGVIERGDKKLSVETLAKIATALNISTDHLLEDSVNQFCHSRTRDMLRLIEDLSPDDIEMVFDVVNTMTLHLKKR